MLYGRQDRNDEETLYYNEIPSGNFLASSSSFFRPDCDLLHFSVKVLARLRVPGRHHRGHDQHDQADHPVEDYLEKKNSNENAEWKKKQYRNFS